MDERRVDRVVVVFEDELPVASVRVLEDAARDLDLAAGRAIDEVVERRSQMAEEFQE